ncbi:MAG: mechanosensitive ion channel family protein [Spirochaetaceae bacterium]|jgi:MscS family membrane protein|nr:mechanosensitive ion channel family protein [Spirochaetaceae bacterium]
MNGWMDTVFWGNTLTVWTSALLIMISGIIAGVLASNTGTLLVSTLIKRHTADDAARERLRKVYRLFKRPIALLFVYGGCRMALQKLVFSGLWELWEKRALDALFTILICWSIRKLLDALIVHLAETKLAESARQAAPGGSRIPEALLQLQPFLRRFFSVLMTLIPFGIILYILGYNISALLAGLGIGGAALALASKDLLSSFFGTASVFIDKSFKAGDRIKIAGYDGFVVDMRMRSSLIKTLDNRMVTIPNSVFQNTPIENVSSEPHTKIFQTISIRAENGLEKTRKAVEILQNLRLENGTPFCPPPEPPPDGTPFFALGEKSFAALTHIGIHVFKISFIFFIARGADYWGTINAVTMEALKRFEAAGIKFDNMP